GWSATRTTKLKRSAVESPFAQPQPYAEPGTGSADASTATPGTTPGSDTLISMAATLAIKQGNPESIKAQLPPEQHAAFDMAYQVQLMRGDSDANEEKRRLSMRTQDEIEKRRAARRAADEIAAEEKAALF